MKFYALVGLLFISCADSQFTGSAAKQQKENQEQPDEVIGSPNEKNNPPTIISKPIEKFQLKAELVNQNFRADEIFIASSVTSQIRVYDSESLEFKKSFSHQLFTGFGSGYQYGPNGMAFNEQGNLVVAGYSHFIEFNDYDKAYKTYPKKNKEATENIVFDKLGNLYTTTSTSGSDKLLQYKSSDYTFSQEIKLPTGSGQLTGITFDELGTLYVASQNDNKIHALSPNKDFTQFTLKKSYTLPYPSVKPEAIQFNQKGELVIAKGGILRYSVSEEKETGTTVPENFNIPLTVKISNDGQIFIANAGNGNGTVSADIISISPDGEIEKRINDKDLYGPFGLVLSKTILPGDKPLPYSYQVQAEDPDNDELTYSLNKGPDRMKINSKSGLLEWEITSSDIGQYEIEILVKDTEGATDTQIFTLAVES